jgi:ACT domain-containing protein
MDTGGQQKTNIQMAKVNIVEAVKLAGISRSHFYEKYVNPGLITITAEGNKKFVDTSELIRVFGELKSVGVRNVNEKTLLDTPDTVKISTEKDQIIELLKSQLEAAQESENWLKEQLDELRRQKNNLLEEERADKKKGWKLF